MSRFKEEIEKKKLPKKLTDSTEWTLFLQLLDTKDLSNHLDTEIQRRREWVNENRNNRKLGSVKRQKTRELEMMDVFRIKILPHL
jgi:hypothetical protein